MKKVILDTLRSAVRFNRRRINDDCNDYRNAEDSVYYEFEIETNEFELKKLEIADEWLCGQVRSIGDRQTNEFDTLLSIAYKATGGSNVRMSNNYAANQSLFTQEFKLRVMPSYNRRCSTIGYKELLVYVHFGNNTDWTGPELSWLYMDRSMRWDGEHVRGGLDDLDGLFRISHRLKVEAKRIRDIEYQYEQENNCSLDGLVIEGYATPKDRQG